jgi:chitinase
VTITVDGDKTLTANFGAAADITPPSVPSNLSWGNDGMTVTLSWGASTDDTGVAGYDLYFGSFFLGTFQETSVSLIGFKSGTPYNFTVKARDAAGNVSAASNQTTVLLTFDDTIPPSAPSNLKTTSVTSSSVSLSWTASTDNVGVVVYQVYRDGMVASTVTAPKATLSGLSMGTSYTFAVTAIDAAGNVSPQSSQLTVMTASP